MLAGVGLVLAIAAAVAFSVYYPIGGAPALKKVPTLSGKAFDGLTLKPGVDKYEGSALVMFTTNVKEDKSCGACVSLDKLIKSSAFRQQHATWWSSQTLRVGKVHCDSQPALCTRFGIQGDDPETGVGTPHILWFKGGAEMGQYPGEHTLEGIREWVEGKQAEKKL